MNNNNHVVVSTTTTATSTQQQNNNIQQKQQKRKRSFRRQKQIRAIIVIVLILFAFSSQQFNYNLLVFDDSSWNNVKNNYYYDTTSLSSSSSTTTWEEMMTFPSSKLFTSNNNNNNNVVESNHYYYHQYCVDNGGGDGDGDDDHHKTSIKKQQQQKQNKLQIQDIMIVTKHDDDSTTNTNINTTTTTTPTTTTTNTDEEKEFPYPLTCRKKDLYQFLIENGLYSCNTNTTTKTTKTIPSPPKNQMKTTQNVTVAITYHVGMMKNWKIVVKDQLTTLFKCGLADIVNDFMLSYSNGDLDTIQQYITNISNQLNSNEPSTTTMPNVIKSTFDSYNNNNNNNTNNSSLSSTSTSFTKITKATGVPWEGDAINMIYEYCQRQLIPEKTIVFYFHNKGVSKYLPLWKKHFYGYSRLLYWRKYLEYFLFERPQLCLYRLLYTKARTCGTNWHYEQRNHYSGNFWSTSCDYVLDVSGKPKLPTKDYTYAEFWLGTRNGRNHPTEWHSSLSTTTSRSLYKDLIYPYEYAFNNFSYLMLNDTELYVV